MGLATLLLTLTASCVLLESALRLTWERPTRMVMGSRSWPFMQPDPELGWTPLQNTRVDYPRYGASFNTNSLGLRGPERSFAKRLGIRRIVVLGDSFAWGHGVDEGESFPELLERMLPHTEVINLGVPGFNVRTEQRYFERIGAAFEPDIVLLALCQNDIHDLDAVERRQEPRASEQLTTLAQTGPEPQDAAASAFRRLKQLFDRNSHIFALCRQTVDSHKSLARAAVRLGLKEELVGFEGLDDNLHASLVAPPPPVIRAYQQLERDVLRLDDCARSHGAQLVIAMVPSLQAVDARELALSLADTRYEPADFDTDQPHRFVRAFADRHGIPIVDPLEAFRTARAGGRQLYLPGDLHFNRAGHHLFAQTAAAALSSLFCAH